MLSMSGCAWSSKVTMSTLRQKCYFTYNQKITINLFVYEDVFETNIAYQLARKGKDMDVNEHERLSNFTPLTTH